MEMKRGERSALWQWHKSRRTVKHFAQRNWNDDRNRL